MSERGSGDAVQFTRVNGGTIEFTLDVSGYYDISVTSESGLSQQHLAILTTNIPDPEPTALEDYDGTTPLDEVVSVVMNQSWVVSQELSETALRELILTSFSELQPKVYDHTQGLLVEYDADSLLVREQLEILKLQQGIAGVHQRVHTGQNADVSFTIDLPDHEELLGRFSQVLTNMESAHGNGTAGAIVGVSDNGIGVTGMNHVSKAVLANWGVHSYVEALEQNELSDDHSIKVVNNSWGPMGNASGSVIGGILFSRAYRQIARNTPDILHVWAAGNNAANATQQNGALYLNNSGSYSPIDNIMVVAAHGPLLAG